MRGQQVDGKDATEGFAMLSIAHVCCGDFVKTIYYYENTA
jgi:hypothetical protein